MCIRDSFNGDMGIITEINDFAETMTVEFDEGRKVEYSYTVSYTHLDVYKRQVIAKGTPEEVAKVKGSYTGQYVKKYLKK